MAGVPPIAVELFGDRVDLAERFHAALLGAGISRGLLGPREAPRLWQRHLANCAVLTDLLPEGTRVVDVGSGAGLPGLVLAIRRPDLRVDLVEPLLRRTEFLSEVVAELGLRQTVRVVRGRAEEAAVRDLVAPAGWVTARAVAPLDRLVRWCVPLLHPDGQLLAVKGARAAEELAEHGAALRGCGATGEVLQCGVGRLVEPTTVIVVRRVGIGVSEPAPRRREPA